MEAVEIFPQGDGAFAKYLKDKQLHDGRIVAIAGLPAGTASGAASVALLVQAADGTFILGQTTLKLLLTAADALKAVHGDPRGD